MMRGIFRSDADAAVGRVPTITILNEQGQQVYEAELPIVQYQPTALEHESGYLTLERYFVGQSYIEREYLSFCRSKYNAIRRIRFNGHLSHNCG